MYTHVSYMCTGVPPFLHMLECAHAIFLCSVLRRNKLEFFFFFSTTTPTQQFLSLKLAYATIAAQQIKCIYTLLTLSLLSIKGFQ